MSDICDGPEKICQYCENAAQTSDPNFYACFNVGLIRMEVLGPRTVRWNHTCKDCVIAKKYGGRGR